MEKRILLDIRMIKIISGLLVVWGAVQLFEHFNVISFTLVRFSQIASGAGLGTTLVSLLYYPLFYGCLFLGGIALFFMKTWGKVLIQTGLIVDILAKLYLIMKALPFITTLAMSTKASLWISLLQGTSDHIIILLRDGVGLYLLARLKIK
ncbi:MAG: hypothetical protein WCI27_07160 [Candidatus Omnitrophota bacterium]